MLEHFASKLRKILNVVFEPLYFLEHSCLKQAIYSQGILLEQASAECILNTAGVAVGDNDVVQSQSALSGVSLAVWYSSSLGSSSFHQNWWLT